jgi:NAD/NADP transhydrogenase alpha subunit
VERLPRVAHAADVGNQRHLRDYRGRGVTADWSRRLDQLPELYAVLIASINIFGGFTVTQRMLKMFRKG